MAITNLTGTKWKLNADLSSATFGNSAYNINFTSKGTEFVHIDLYQVGDVKSLAYKSDDGTYIFPYASSSGEWTDTDYQYIEITGGTDVTSAALISWLGTNAVPDIRGAWKFKNAPTIAAGDLGTYTLEFTSGTTSCTSIVLGHDDQYNYDYIRYGGVMFNVYASNSGWSSDGWKAIILTGGTDITNATFVAWLQANADPVPKMAFALIGCSSTATFPEYATESSTTIFLSTFTADDGYTMTDFDYYSINASCRTDVLWGNIVLIVENVTADATILVMAKSTDDTPRLIKQSTLVDIANAARMVTGKTTKSEVSDLAGEIKAALQS